LLALAGVHHFVHVSRIRVNGYQVSNWTFRKVNQKYLGSFEMWCWRRLEKISWSDRVTNKVVRTVKEGRYILLTIKRRKANWIDRILRRNCLLKYVLFLRKDRGKDISGGKMRKKM
jgi:hypothetical protein